MKKKAISLITIIALVISIFQGSQLLIADSLIINDGFTDSVDISNLQHILSFDVDREVTNAPLVEKMSDNKLDINPLPSYLPKQSSIIYDTYEAYLLNFTYQKIYQINAHQDHSGDIVHYDIDESVEITLFASLPVILLVYRNTTVETDQHTQVITKSILDDNYKARASLSVDFIIDYYFEFDVFSLVTVGPGSVSIPVFNRNWEFDTPLDGKAILDKVSIPFYSAGIASIGVAIGPEIDADFTSKVKVNNPNITLSQDELLWDKDGSIQSFSYYVPEFFSEDSILLELFDFNMDLILNLVLYLEIKLDLLLFSKTFHFPIFAFPVTSEQLSCENVSTLNLDTTVIPNDNPPFVYGIDYWYEDTLGDVDGLIERGETIDFGFWLGNIGNGSALKINTTATCDNFTVTGSDSLPILYKNLDNYGYQSGFQFTIPTDFAASYFWIDVLIEYLGVNGTYYSTVYYIYMPCVLPESLFLEVNFVGWILEDMDSYWYSGKDVALYFNVTNRGYYDIDYADITLWGYYDTDQTYPVSYITWYTNWTSLAVGESAILGYINFSSSLLHDKGLVLVGFDIYYDNATSYNYDYMEFGVPIRIPKPDIDLDAAWVFELGDGDGLWEAGETVELEFDITNWGEGTAYDIYGYLTSSNPDINYTIPEVYFYDLDPYESGTSTRARRIISITAKNQTAYYILHIVAKDLRGNEYYFNFNISTQIVEKPLPELDLLFYDYIDLGDGDDIIEPGEYFLLYIVVNVTNTAFSLSGAATTDSSLIFYNASSYYGFTEDDYSWGDGFIVYVPLDYPGGDSRIDVFISAESYSGRKVNASAYLLLNIDKGDLSAPTISSLDTIPTSVVQGSTLSFNIAVQEPNPVDEIVSGLYGVFLIWSFNGGEVEVTELIDPEIDGTYNIILDTTVLGTYEFVIVAIDNADNIQVLDNGGLAFLIQINPVVSEFPTILYLGVILILQVSATLTKKIKSQKIKK